MIINNGSDELRRDVNEIITSLGTVVIFRKILSDPVTAGFVKALKAAENGENTERAVGYYCDFAESLYRYGEDFTEYLLTRVLEDENMYILRRAEEGRSGALMDECLANELYTLGRLGAVTFDEMRELLGYDGFLPAYRTSERDFSAAYADRIHNLSKHGFGIYSSHHVFVVENGRPVPVDHPDDISLSQLYGYERERGEVIDNTLALLGGRPANNVLLYGQCGTGKSSAVKAIANEFAKDGLRLIEIKKKQLHELPDIINVICRNPLKFIIFIDDLSFTEDDDDYAALKAILEGSVNSSAGNVAIYATSNRRHLVRETFSSRQGDEVHFNDTMQELLSLSDRFGLTVTFSKPSKDLYLEVVEQLANQYEIATPLEELFKQAEVFALSRGGRSPRTAKQFVKYVKGMEEL